ncbi:MAG: hypothetical protein RLZZ292_1005 [Bacteroidota bacterium]|jgi:hypothetical protein
MDAAKTKQYWMLFGITTAIMAAMLITSAYREWFWVVLPFPLTYFVKAKDWI